MNLILCLKYCLFLFMSIFFFIYFALYLIIKAEFTCLFGNSGISQIVVFGLLNPFIPKFKLYETLKHQGKLLIY